MLARSADGKFLVLPALTTAHSHAFQRAMRGAAQRPAASSGPRDDFWSWRGAMYRVATGLDPESIERISRVAFRELRAAGVRTVGEFHYVHHRPDGTPYDDRTAMSDAVIRAAKAEGLRIALLRVAYHRAGPGREAEPAQRRFCDARVEDVVRDVESLRAKYENDADVRIGIAPHSVRAVPPEWIRELAAYATTHDLPFHMHVAEQTREIEECLVETGKRPIELLADLGALTKRFVAVHATHLLAHEAELLGRARAFACVCATTEADLGDGLPDLVALRAAGARLCTGVDSHVITDPLADLRALETLPRLASQKRVTFTPASGTPAETLWLAGSIEGAVSCGFEDDGGTLRIPVDHPALALVEEELMLDAIVFGGSSAMVASIAT
ncbi:Formiminoglutamic iminohydrolase [Labilithrix luteola]|uniref:Formiminoglutamic iminohydrolase n=2 Tax=Labilithrix luteola TaxID=1391654 RepID=A0A0K1PLY1_9BACT|nr:Formiminoglutamic iminohydrolase [Labilithrix luteola]